MTSSAHYKLISSDVAIGKSYIILFELLKVDFGLILLLFQIMK